MLELQENSAQQQGRPQRWYSPVRGLLCRGKPLAMLPVSTVASRTLHRFTDPAICLSAALSQNSSSKRMMLSVASLKDQFEGCVEM